MKHEAPIEIISCVDPKHTLAWIQTKKLSCVDPNQKVSLCGSKPKQLSCVDPSQKVSLCGSKLDLCGSQPDDGYRCPSTPDQAGRRTTRGRTVGRSHSVR